MEQLYCFNIILQKTDNYAMHVFQRLLNLLFEKIQQKNFNARTAIFHINVNKNFIQKKLNTVIRYGLKIFYTGVEKYI